MEVIHDDPDWQEIDELAAELEIEDAYQRKLNRLVRPALALRMIGWMALSFVTVVAFMAPEQIPSPGWRSCAEVYRVLLAFVLVFHGAMALRRWHSRRTGGEPGIQPERSKAAMWAKLTVVLPTPILAAIFLRQQGMPTALAVVVILVACLAQDVVSFLNRPLLNRINDMLDLYNLPLTECDEQPDEAE